MSTVPEDNTATAGPATVAAVAEAPSTPSTETIVQKVEEFVEHLLHPTEGQPVTTAAPAIAPVVTPVATNEGASTIVQPIVEPGTAHIPNPAVDHAIAAAGVKIEPTTNTGAALAEQRAAFKVGSAQAGNAMDTMHGAVNHTWPPTIR